MFKTPKAKKCPCGAFAPAPGKHQGRCTFRDGKRQPSTLRIPAQARVGDMGGSERRSALTVDEVYSRLEVHVLTEDDLHKDEGFLAGASYQPLPGSKGGYNSEPAIPERLVLNGRFLSPQSSMWHHLVYDDKGNIVIHPERLELYDEIIKSIVGGVPRSDNPTFTFMGGGPAAGKSSIISGAYENEEGSYVKLNSDEIKEKIPEYQALVGSGDKDAVSSAAAVCHEESSFIAAEVQAVALANKQDVLLDGCGGGTPEKILKKANSVRAEGYEVKAIYVTAPTATAVARSIRRGFRTGRHVPLGVVTDSHTNISQMLPVAMQNGTFDEVELWDTCPAGGGPSQRVATASKGVGVRVANKDAWNDFLKKGAGDPHAQKVISFYEKHINLPGGEGDILNFLDGLGL